MNIKYTFFLVWLALAVTACTDSSDRRGTTVPVAQKTEAQLLKEQFGTGAEFFTEQGMQAILEFEDTASPIILLQLISVTDTDGFSRYEAESDALWTSVGATTRFASSIFAQLIGDRPLVAVRAIEFPNIAMLSDIINTSEFTSAMDTLFSASDDHVWALGVEEALPFKPSGSYFDPSLQNVDAAQATELLQMAGNDSGFDSNEELIIDMIVSDDPSPFWMVNLIDFFEQANYADGRSTELTGAQANEIYGRAIFPTLAAYNSFPEFLMPIEVVLTEESVDWEQAAIVRYASRDAFLNIFPLNPNSNEAVVHKEAGVENTLVYASSVDSEQLPVPESGFLYNFRYCEVLLSTSDQGGFRADVYNSIGLSTCPQDQWDALDANAIAQQFDSDSVFLNGIRFWVLDRIEANTPSGSDPVIEDFGGIRMRLAASVLLPEPSFPDDFRDSGYQVSSVTRDTIFHYAAGRQVYELQDPDGHRYMMQSFSRVVDKNLQLEDLQSLGPRLDLPPGWSFSTRILSENFELPTVDGVAKVTTDNLNNTYQRIP